MTGNTFYLDYNVTGAERKRLVKAISEYTQADSKYLGAPTFAYEVDYFTIDRNGVVSFDDRADSEEIEGLIEALVEQGFVSQVSNLGCEDEDQSEDTAPCTDGATEPHGCGLTVTMPISTLSTDAQYNLGAIIASKGSLIRSALGIEHLPVRFTDETASFPWFEGVELNADECRAYSRFIAALCEMARTQKRVTAKEKEIDNEKYAFRCFLLRLGFIGEEYKADRKILLGKLSGSSAFKSGSRKEPTLKPEPIDSSKAVEIPEGMDSELAEAMMDELLIQQVNAIEEVS